LKFLNEAELREHLADVRHALDTERDPETRRRLQAEATATENAITGLENRRVDVVRAGRDPVNHDGYGSSSASTTRAGTADQSAALRTIERHADVLRSEAGDRLEQLVRSGDPTGVGARYLTAVGNPAYDTAFGKILIDPTHGHLRFSAEEVEAVRRVSAAQNERAMSIGGSGGADGGFGVPFALDPTIVLSSDGSSSPIREFARTFTIATNTWKGVSSEGVTAEFAAELTEVGDDTPTLVQPSVDVEKAHAWIEFSIEVGQDYAGLRDELGRLFADAKDELEATKFLDGTGTNEPSGVLDGLTAAETVYTATVNAFAVDDCYSLLNAIPPRYATRTSVLGSPAIFDEVYRFVGGGSDEPPVLPTREGAFLGRRKGEWSSMSSTIAADEALLIAGDFGAGFAIVDRVGMSVELVPHVLGSNRRPKGSRGLYAWWRVGSGVVLPNALRVLVVDPSS
jgi:HK97 family phage major capsid protein